MKSSVPVNNSLIQSSFFKYILLLGGLAFFWAIENFILQASAFSVPPITKYPYFYQGIRIILNFLAAVIVLLLLNRFWVIFIMVLDCLISLVIVAYNQYFKEVLSAYYAIKTLKEGLRVVGLAVHIIPPLVWGLLIGSLTIKIIWVIRTTSNPYPYKFRQLAGILCLILFATIILLLQLTSFKFISIRETMVRRAIYAYGFLTAWIAESLVAIDKHEDLRELIQLQSISPDRLEKIEPPWSVGNKIIIVQLESFDFDILNYRIQGREVTPYFNQLIRNSRLFKIIAYHNVSSADMDYAVLSGGIPSSRIISYTVPDIPYNNSLPLFLKKHGYHTVSWHGNNGDFFNRRLNYKRMGFDEIYFKEDLKGMPLTHSYWGIRDSEIFRLSSQKIRASLKHEFHFIITLDSHGPFDLISDDEKEIFPKSKKWQENYFNSIHILDRNVKNYLESLPPGTLVILYGDHASGVNYGNFQSAKEGKTEYVPCIVHICQSSLVWPQPPLIDDLRILDVINHLRRQIAR